MPFNPTNQSAQDRALLAALQTVPYAGNPAATPPTSALSDADAAALASTPVMVPRSGWITLTTLIAVWGFAKATSFVSALNAAVAAGQASGASSQAQQVAAYANTLIQLLQGPGFSATDPNVGPNVSTFVALPNSGITSDDATAILQVPTYPLGQPSTSDVTAARLLLAQKRLQQQVLAGLSAAMKLLAPTQSTLPTATQLQQAFSAVVTG